MKLKLMAGALVLCSLAACASHGEQPEIVAKPHTKIAKASILPSKDIPTERDGIPADQSGMPSRSVGMSLLGRMLALAILVWGLATISGCSPWDAQAARLQSTRAPAISLSFIDPPLIMSQESIPPIGPCDNMYGQIVQAVECPSDWEDPS